MKPETLFKVKVMDHLKKMENVWFVKIQQMSICGTPDLLICVRGVFVALELKKDDKEKPTKLQQYNLDEIERCGGIAMVASPQNWNYIYYVLRKLNEGAR